MPAHQSVIAKSTINRPVKTLAQLRIITKLRMHIERQVIGKQVHAAGQQFGYTSTPRTQYACIFAAPEPAVMHQQCISLSLMCCANQRKTCGDTTDHTTDRPITFHLQAVWAIILKAARAQNVFNTGLQLGCLYGRRASGSLLV
jgi:hypothetical protein